MSRKLIVWASWSVVAIFLVYGAYTAGYFSGRSHQIKVETERDALRLYEYLKKGDAKEACAVGLLSEETLETANELERKLGRVLDATIQKIHSTPLGLPVVVDLLVKREKSQNREHVGRHGADGNTLEFWGPQERPPR